MPELGKATYVIEIDSRQFDRALDRIEKRTKKSADAQDKQMSEMADGWDRITANVRKTGDEHDRTNKKVKETGLKFIALNQALGLVGKALSALKLPAMGAAIGALGGAVGALSGGLAALTSVVGSATASLVSMASAMGPLVGLGTTLVSVYGALGQAMGTVKLASVGVSDALAAQTAAIEGGKEEMKAYREELKKLPEPAREFVKQLGKMRPMFDDLKETAAGSLFPGVNKGLEAATKNFDRLDSVVEVTGDSLGHLATRAGRFLGSDGFGRDFEKIGTTNARLLRQMGAGGLELASALRHVLVVGRPLTRWVSRSVRGWTESVDSQAKAARESGRMADFFERTKKTVKVFTSLAGNLFGVLVDVGSAGRKSGLTIFKAWDKALGKFREWTGSAEGQDRMARFFERSRKAASALWDVIKPFGAALVQIGHLGRRVGMDMVKSMGAAAEQFEDWTKSATGKRSIRQFFEATQPVVESLGRSVSFLVKALLKMGQMPVMEKMAKQLERVLPPTVKLLRQMTKTIGPALIDTFGAFVEMINSLSWQPAAVLAEALGGVFKAVTYINETVPGFSEFISFLTTFVTIVSGIGFAKWISGVLGFRKGLEALSKVPGLRTVSTKMLDMFTALRTRWVDLIDWWNVKGSVGLKTAAVDMIDAFRMKMKAGFQRVRDLVAGIMGRAQVWVTSAAGAVSEFVGGMVTRFKGSALGRRLGNVFRAIAVQMGKIMTATIAAAVIAGEGIAGAAGGLAGKLREKLPKRMGSVGSKVGAAFGKGFMFGVLLFVYPLAEQIVKVIEGALSNIELPWGGKLPSPTDVVDPIDLIGKGIFGKDIKTPTDVIMDLPGKLLPGGQQGGLVQGFQGGGWVGNRPTAPGPKDTVPAMLQPGEFVVSKEMVDLTRKNSKETAKVLTAELGDGYKKAGDATKKFQEEHRKRVEKMRDDAGERVTQMRVATVKDFAKMRDDSVDRVEKMADGSGTRFAKMRDDLSKRAQETARNVGGSYRSLQGAVSQALKKIGDQTNRALAALGADRINFGVEQDGGKGAQKKRAGGTIVGGRGSGDKVPAALEPGEVVWNREAVRRMGGAHAANAPNRLFKRFAKGGVVGGGLKFALGPYDIPPIQYAADHAGRNSHVHVTGTTTPWIVALGRKLQQMGFMVSEHPAFGGVNAQHSPTGGHYDALAIDVNSAADETRSEVAQIARMLGGGGFSAAGAANMIDRIKITGRGPLRGLGQLAVDKVRKAANALIQKKSMMGMAGHGAVMSASGPVQAIFAKVAKRLSRSKVATLALGMAGFAESGMRDLPGGDASSSGALQLLAATAQGLGVSPHDEAAIASLFFTTGFYGRGGANSLAAQGLPAHLVAQGVQGSAFADGSNYLAQKGAAQAWMRRYGLRRGGRVGFRGRTNRRIERLLERVQHFRRMKHLNKNQVARMRSVVARLGAQRGILGYQDELRGARKQRRRTGNLVAPVLADFMGMPEFGGVFHREGVVPGRRSQERTIIATGGEIVAKPETFAAAMSGGTGAIYVDVRVEDEAVDTNKIRVVVRDENRRVVSNARRRVSRGV